MLFPVKQTAGTATLTTTFMIDPSDDGDNDGRVPITNAPIRLLATAPAGGFFFFSWSQTAGPAVDFPSFTFAASSTMDFTPPVAGRYSFQVTATRNDGARLGRALDVIVDSAGNSPPTAEAGSLQLADVGDTVTLSGAASADSGVDPDGVTGFASGLRPIWVQLAGAPVTLTNGTTSTPSFIPRAAGVYVFGLRVSDGPTDSTMDFVEVLVDAAAVQAAGSSGSSGSCGGLGVEALLLAGAALLLRKRLRRRLR